MNKLKLVKKILKDNKGQVSLEFLIVLSVIILSAILVGYYLKQTAAKSTMQTDSVQEQILNN